MRSPTRRRRRSTQRSPTQRPPTQRPPTQHPPTQRPLDASSLDASSLDASSLDASSLDASSLDAPSIDAPPDAPPQDASAPDASPLDASVEDGETLPPDPSTVATPIDPAVATDLYSATAFLFTGPNPIQTGVAPDAIDPERAAVVRGRVGGRDGSPLSGAAVSVLGRPELGGTLTRADGAFDLAVNGGARLTQSSAQTRRRLPARGASASIDRSTTTSTTSSTSRSAGSCPPATTTARPTGETRLAVTFPDGGRSTILSAAALESVTLRDGTTVTRKKAADPRFLFETPVIVEQTVRTPSGLSAGWTRTIEATLATPGAPLSRREGQRRTGHALRL